MRRDEIGIIDNEESVWDTVQSWITNLKDRFAMIAAVPIDVEFAHPQFPSVDLSTVSIPGNTYSIPIKAEIELGMGSYMREVSRQNAILEEQNRILRDIREKPVIQDSDVFASYSGNRGRIL